MFYNYKFSIFFLIPILFIYPNQNFISQALVV